MKLLYALLCMSIGACLACWVKRRRFNRTNKYGTEEFRSYAGKVAATSMEKLLWGVAMVLIVVGALLVL